MLHPQIETFMLVVENGNFSRAAAIRNCSTISIMNHINSLESRIGFQLLERSTHGVKLTPSGEELYIESKKIMEAAHKAIIKAKAKSRMQVPVIRIGTSFLRPCNPLIDYLDKYDKSIRKNFQIQIVTFDDNPKEFTKLLKKLGKEIDCFVSPCDSASWIEKLNIYRLGECKCCIAVPLNHRLEHKQKLIWNDLDDESLILVSRGISPILDRLREEIESKHPEINIIDAPAYYDIEVFNKCEKSGYLMETPEIWSGIHPSLVTLPVEWEYMLPYGIVYAEKPSADFKEFINTIS